MLKSSTRNSAPNRSLNIKVLNTEKSTFLKPESRKMFRPIVPKVPAVGGVMTDLPETKQPPIFSVVGSGATAAHWDASEEGSGVTMPLMPDCDEQLAPPVVAAPVAGSTPKPEQKGMEFGPDLKSPGFPKKSQRSAASWRLPLKSLLLSPRSHGKAP